MPNIGFFFLIPWFINPETTPRKLDGNESGRSIRQTEFKKFVVIQTAVVRIANMARVTNQS